MSEPSHSPENSTSSILFLLGQLTAKVDALLDNLHTHSERHDALDGRVTALERDKSKIVGGVIVISAVVALGVDLFIK